MYGFPVSTVRVHTFTIHVSFLEGFRAELKDEVDSSETPVKKYNKNMLNDYRKYNILLKN